MPLLQPPALSAGAFSLIAALLCAGPARAARIPPGQEELAADMLGRGATLPGGCRWDGASVRPDQVESRYVCPGLPDPLELVLVAPDAGAPPNTTQTELFKLIPANPSTFPQALLLDLAARIRARESKWVWDIDAKPIPPNEPLAREARRLRRMWPNSIRAVLMATCCAALVSLVLLLLSRRRRDDGPWKQPAATAPVPSTLALLSLGALALSIGLFLGRFRFVFDDYRFLVRAIENPWMWDESLRVISTSALFRFAAVVDPGGITPFLAANALALGVGAACWALVLRRNGFERDEAVLAAAWFGLSPGAPDMLRRASGIENLAGSAVVVIVLYLLMRLTAAARADRAGRAGFVGLLFVASVAGVFIKFPFMAVVPPMVWLWLRGVSPQSMHRAGAAALAVGLAAAILIPCALGLPGAESLKIGWTVGFASIGQNLRFSMQTLAPWMTALAAALGVLAAYRLATAARSNGPDRRGGFRAASREAGRIVRDARAALCTRVGALALWVLMLALAALFAAPTLFNVGYFSRHYVFLSTAPLAALAARLLFRIGDPRRTPWAAQAFAVLVAVPWGALRPDPPSIPTERAAAWLAELRHLARGHPKPDRVVFIPACSSPDETARSAEELHLVYLAAGGQPGVQWATDWRDSAAEWAPPVVQQTWPLPPRSSYDLAVYVCDGHPMSLSPPAVMRESAADRDPLPR